MLDGQLEVKESFDDCFLPTSDQLGVEIDEVDASLVAASWFNAFSESVEAEDISEVASLFLDEALWRDILALTWDHRTFEGLPRVTQFLTDVLSGAGLSAMHLHKDRINFERLAPDLAWVTGMFSFETNFGIGTGVFRIVPTSAGAWKAYTLFTLLEGIKGHPECLGALRNPIPDHGMWTEKRRREMNFEDGEPAVVIIGAGHTGLEFAARMKVLGIPALVLEKNKRVGDNWRGRYESLSLHNPVCAYLSCRYDRHVLKKIHSYYRG